VSVTVEPVRTQRGPLADLHLGRRARSNLPVAELYEHAIDRGEGLLAAEGPLVVRTGKHTGRSPKDKFTVDEPSTHDGVWWGGFNQPISQARFEALRRRFIKHLAEKNLFEQDLFVGADPAHRRSVRVFTESAWASIFARNLFIRPAPSELAGYEPDFLIVDAPSFRADPERDGTRSETVILVHYGRREIWIGGTEYAGEMKKGAFGVMNYLLPDEGVLPMHSAVNVGSHGDVAIFFGLSGTGKAGARAASSTSRAAATRRPSSCRTSTSPTSTPPRGASARSWRTWPSTSRRASSTSTPTSSPRTPAAPIRSSSSATPT
jgi:phosphoenolpyruvate carboxykinase (ATP)